MSISMLVVVVARSMICRDGTGDRLVKRALLFATILLLVQSLTPAFGFEGGDTGTYRILKYRVMLTPQKDGGTRIDYYQQWKVTDGHIPWITVGVPNDDYSVIDSSTTVSDVSAIDEGDRSLVRLNLDHDYQQGDIFEINFSIYQRQLFANGKGKYTIDFTPGWYDRAAIDELTICVKPLCDVSEVTADPQPSSVNGNQMVWIRSNLSEGEQVSISISFSRDYAPDAAVRSNELDDTGTGGVGGFVGLIVIVGFVVVFYGFILKSSKYSGGRIYRGGGGGSCYYDSCACACACVSCACACACAGGGGAGCSRKLDHRCPVCTAAKRAMEKTAR